MRIQRRDNLLCFSMGSPVRIRQSRRAPYSGRSGVLMGVDARDNRGPYIVRFEDGTQFRYKTEEIEFVEVPAQRARSGKMMSQLYKFFAGLMVFLEEFIQSPLSVNQPRTNPSVPPRF